MVDNEGLGRKKSKVCCIFHKSRDVGESSSEDDSDSDSGNDDGGARMVGGARGRKGGENRHGKDCDHGHEKGSERKPSPNAYERQPKYDVKPLTQQPGSR